MQTLGLPLDAISMIADVSSAQIAMKAKENRRTALSSERVGYIQTLGLPLLG